MNIVSSVDCCRISGELLANGNELFSVENCPLAGCYPDNRDESVHLRVPLRVIQARESRLVQLAHRLDPAIYTRYAFSGAICGGYTSHQRQVGERIRKRFPNDAKVLEIGCGDGYLLRHLRSMGWQKLHGIEPSSVVCEKEMRIVNGFFPNDMPSEWTGSGFDLILVRQVLEHVESPLSFVTALSLALSRSGEAWIEVPDLDATLTGSQFSNFHPLHCSYFTKNTMNMLMAIGGLAPVASEMVDVFGGSLLARFAHADASVKPAGRDRIYEARADLLTFINRLTASAEGLPSKTVGYGAAERTASLLGLCPAIEKHIDTLFDSNPLFHNRYLGGTALPIRSPELLYRAQPAGIVLFATSHSAEILSDLKRHLPGKTMVLIADKSARLSTLKDAAA